ncbi:hypothetical protein HanPSC8_Chr14g0613841 [Helianthus annuus]|nr:hypothetical protein HanPSC8_Chr14g0613841 [Helianthus annuus]
MFSTPSKISSFITAISLLNVFFFISIIYYFIELTKWYKECMNRSFTNFDSLKKCYFWFDLKI